MDIDRYCKRQDLNWGSLPELNGRLERLGFRVRLIRARLRRYPDTTTHDNLEDASRDAAVNGNPESFNISLDLEPPTTFRNLTISSTDHAVLLMMYGIERTSDVDSVMEFLGLQPAEPITLPPKRPRTAFIGHRFNRLGVAVADKLARFLELLGFRVITGREYSPQSIAKKVLARIESQEVVFVVLTKGDDNTWLTQESVIAEVKGKPLVTIKERGAEFKSGILADHEYIPFTAPDIETAFVPVLEGLRELGYLDFE